ncbi:hypothetical protein BJX76DRAFT_353437 [Aspergillus varians]
MSVKQLIRQLRNSRKSTQEKHRFERKLSKARRKRAKDAYLGDLELATITDQREWVSDHMEEENRGVAILQRLQRLDSNEGKAGEGKKEAKLSQERKVELLNTFIVNNRRVTGHWKSRPAGNTTKAYEMDCNNRDPDHGRRAQWYNERAMCAELGGCCGRECGCCMKPVTRYIVHLEEEKKPVPLYGHCTAECGCCIQERGFYVPDARLLAIGLGEESGSIDVMRGFVLDVR